MPHHKYSKLYALCFLVRILKLFLQKDMKSWDLSGMANFDHGLMIWINWEVVY